MTKRQRYEHKLGNAIRARAGGNKTAWPRVTRWMNRLAALKQKAK